MARNKKYRSAAVRFGPALKAFGLCLLIGGSGIGYVFQKQSIFNLGQEIKKREQRLAEVERQNDQLRKNLATMRSPIYLEAQIKRLQLGLVAPPMSSVWQLPEPVAEPAQPEAEAAYVVEARR